MKSLKVSLIVALILALSIPLAALAEEVPGITISAEANVESSTELDVKASVAVRTEIADEDVEGASKELSQNVKDVSGVFKKYAEGSMEKKWKRGTTKDGVVSAKGEFRLKTKNIADLSEALIESAAEGPRLYLPLIKKRRSLPQRRSTMARTTTLHFPHAKSLTTQALLQER